MARKLLTVVAFFVAGWFAYSTLVAVDTGDVVAYNGLDRHIGTAAYRAGDLVALSPEGIPKSAICALEVPEERMQVALLDKAYVNRLRDSLPEVGALTGWLVSLAGGEGGGPDLPEGDARLSFRGLLSSIPGSGLTVPMDEACTCDIAQAILRREQICVVERALVEETFLPAEGGGGPRVTRRTVGATFKPSNVIIADFSALRNCPQVANANREFVAQEGLCGEGSHFRYDVALRSSLGVIREDAIN